MGVEIRPMREDERERVSEIHEQAFGQSADRLAMTRAAPRDEVRVLVAQGRVQAALRVQRFGQFFGGESVASAGIGAVKVVPEARGKGYAKMLVGEAIAELRTTGVAITTLYPGGLSLYRGIGFEIAGAYVRYRLPIASLPRDGQLAVEPWDDERSADDARVCYRCVASASAGLIDRQDGWWPERILGADADQRVYRYEVRRDGVMAGYVVYTHEVDPSDVRYSVSLVCRDLVWQDAEAARALLGFVAAHRSRAINVTWPGTVEEPLSWVLGGQDIRVHDASRWMTRILDVGAALESRGYPESVEGAVELTVTDTVLAGNSCSARLEVSGGRCRVRSASANGGRGAVMDVGALAAMYTGWLPAREAVRAGRLHNTSARDRSMLETMFSGPKPSMFELF